MVPGCFGCLLRIKCSVEAFNGSTSPNEASPGRPTLKATDSGDCHARNAAFALSPKYTLALFRSSGLPHTHGDIRLHEEDIAELDQEVFGDHAGK